MRYGKAVAGLGAAAGMSAVAVWLVAGLVTGYERRIEAARQQHEARVMVAVASRDIYPGLPIDETDLYALQMSPEYVPEGVFLSPDHLVGRMARERILANELVRGERLVDLERGGGLNAVVPRGLRAMSVSLTDGRALSGLLQPGNYVDVVFTVPRRGDGTADDETTTLLQGVYVLGVDSRMGQEDAEEAARARGHHSPTVTLLVDPTDAERLAHATTLGEIRLTLRHAQDLAPVDLSKPGKPEPEVAPKARAATPEKVRCQEVWIYHGGKRVVILVDDHGKACVDGRL
ncbi:MAG: Flp pilus assembly protein CpaB [Myxococcales bacterium]|nr:Flp pilus assembly protein CpaB [Myxococcales bacterium]